MSSKSQPSAPPSPDPVALANAQAGANVSAANQTAQINRVNQISPYGSSIYYGPGQYQGGTGSTGSAPSSPQPASQPMAPMPAPTPQGPMSNGQAVYNRGGVPVFASGQQVHDNAFESHGKVLSGLNLPAFMAQQNVGRSGPDPDENGDAWQGPDATGLSPMPQYSPVSGYTGEEGSGWNNPSSMLDQAVTRGGPMAAGAIGGLGPASLPGMALNYAAQQFPNAVQTNPGNISYGGQGPAGPGGQATPQQIAARQAIQGNGTMSGQGSTDPGYNGANSGFQPWTQVTTLDPADQQNLDKQRGLTSSLYGLGQDQIGRINSAVSKPLDFASLGAAPNPQDYINPNQQVVDALYGTQTSRLGPQWDQERVRLETQLQNQGITLQTNPAAYENAFRQYTQGRTDAYQQALAQAMGMGVNQSNNAFNQGMQSRQQGIQEQLTQRNQPINELAAILGSSPGVSSPQFGGVAGAGVNPVNTLGASQSAYDAQANAFNQGQANNRSNTGALAGLAGTALQVGMGGKRAA